MAALIKFSNEETWFSPSWVYFNLMENIILNTKQANPEIADKFTDLYNSGFNGFLHVQEDLNNQELLIFYNSFLSCFEYICSPKGYDDFYDKKFYPGMKSSLEKLKVVLEKEINLRKIEQ